MIKTCLNCSSNVYPLPASMDCIAGEVDGPEEPDGEELDINVEVGSTFDEVTELASVLNGMASPLEETTEAARLAK